MLCPFHIKPFLGFLVGNLFSDCRKSSVGFFLSRIGQYLAVAVSIVFLSDIIPDSIDVYKRQP